MKQVLRELFHHTIARLDPAAALDNKWDSLDSDLRDSISGGTATGGRIIVVAFGKAALPMTSWLLKKTTSKNILGIVSAPSLPDRMFAGLDCFSGGHPVPNASSLLAARTALNLAKNTTKDDLVVYLVSGGGSSLLELPVSDDIPPADLTALYGLLVSCGADIVEINTIRKHLSAVKGGRLAEAAAPARQVTLYISDVPTDHESSVASGPAMPDETTLADFYRISRKYELADRSPRPVKPFLVPGGPVSETPGPGDHVFDRSDWYRVLDNSDAVAEARRFASREGWKTAVDNSVDDLNLKTAADRLLSGLDRLAGVSSGNVPVCVVSGGELSVTVEGDGVGGRNQAFVLECVPRIANRRIAVLSAGTDGIDGNSPAAGAVADGTTLERANSSGLSPEKYSGNSDSHTFFDILGDTISCGPTQTNVRDIRVLVSW